MKPTYNPEVLPSFLIGMLASLLPERLRAKWVRERLLDLHRPAIASGMLQLAVCLGSFVFGFRSFIQSQIAQLDHRVFAAGAETAGETGVMGVGLIFAVAYILRPLSIALVYFAFEGGVRAIAAFVSNEIIGTLPMYLLLVLGRKSEKEIREYKLGARVRDEVVCAPDGEMDYDLVISSCRPKPWNQSLTISYQDQLYEMVRSVDADAPRRFVYLLKKAPLSKLVRGLHHYDPEEGVTAESVVEP